MATKRRLSNTRTRLPRRALLRSAVVAAAAPYFVPRPVLGGPGKTAASDRIAIGCIGTGGRGTSLIRSFLPHQPARIVAVCDAVADRRQRARKLVEKHYGTSAGRSGCDETGDFRKIIARKDIDAVIIATQDHWHALIAVAAAGAGKDIYCEKPLGVAVGEGQAMQKAVRRHARIFQTGTQQRSARQFRFACELARNGYLGKVHTVVVGAPGPTYKQRYRGPTTPQPVPPGLDYDMYVGPAPMKPYNQGRLDWPGWYLIWDYCAGFIVNWGVHHLDIACWGCPAIGTKPFEVTCKATYRNDKLSDNINSWQAEYRYPDGLKMSFTDTGHPNAQGCKFIGDKGWVHVNRGGISADPKSLLKVTLKPTAVRLHESRHHQADFLTAVRSRRDPVSPVESGLAASNLGLIGEIAGRLAAKLRWDPAKGTFLTADRANRLLRRPMRHPWAL